MFKSQAFQRAILKSESYRIFGLLCLLAALMVYVLARGLATGEFRQRAATIVVLAVAIGCEAVMSTLVKKALRTETDIPSAVWILNVLVETQIPTIAIFLLIRSQLFTPYQSLVAPAVLLYFLFIILSTLRLSPRLSLLTGIGSCLGYLAITAYVSMNFSHPGEPTFPLSVYLVYGTLILGAGVIAAVVAGQIRLHVGAALHEAELQAALERVNHDLDTARSIQQGLLPTVAPRLKQFEVAGWNQPADQTGGDYFDWQTLPDGRVAISLGDATGHGIGPALVSVSCRAYARASFLASGATDGVLEDLNDLLASDLSTNRFVTFAVVLLDPLTSRINVLSAGHGPMLWYRYTTEEIASLDAQGIPLGMIGGVKYEKGTEACLAPGDMLVLVTDGFYEWENPEGEQFGLERLNGCIRRCRDCSADEVIGSLRASVAEFCQGTEQKDDLTAVVLKRKREE